MPTLGQILDDIYMLYPHSMTDAQVTTLLNYEQREIFRELQIKDPQTFTTTADVEVYPLPTNCKIEDVEEISIIKNTSVTSSSKPIKHSFAELSEEMTGNRYFDTLNQTFGLYPIPSTTGWIGTIIFKKRPTNLDSTNQSMTPDLNEDWHRILVYAGVIEVAGAGPNPDTDTVNIHTLKYNALMKEIKQSRYERMPKYASTKDVMKKARNSYGSREVVDNV